MYFAGYNIIARKRRQSHFIQPNWDSGPGMMSPEACARCTKYLFIAFNFIFWLSGSAVMSVGIWIRVDPTIEYYFKNFSNLDLSLDYLFIAAYILIGVGALVFIVGFWGCCGAVRENTRLLGVYILCMVVIMTAELAAGIYVAVKKDELKEKLRTGLHKAVDVYTGHANSTMNFLQMKFMCCGADNYTDYLHTPWYQNNGDKNGMYIPSSCCVLDNKDNLYPRPLDTRECMNEARLSRSDPKYMYTQGCHTELLKWVSDNSIVLIGVGIGLAVVELMGVVFALCFCRQIPELQEERMAGYHKYHKSLS